MLRKFTELYDFTDEDYAFFPITQGSREPKLGEMRATRKILHKFSDFSPEADEKSYSVLKKLVHAAKNGCYQKLSKMITELCDNSDIDTLFFENGEGDFIFENILSNEYLKDKERYDLIKMLIDHLGLGELFTFLFSYPERMKLLSENSTFHPLIAYMAEYHNKTAYHGNKIIWGEIIKINPIWMMNLLLESFHTSWGESLIFSFALQWINSCCKETSVISAYHQIENVLNKKMADETFKNKLDSKKLKSMDMDILKIAKQKILLLGQTKTNTHSEEEEKGIVTILSKHRSQNCCSQFFQTKSLRLYYLSINDKKEAAKKTQDENHKLDKYYKKYWIPRG